MAFMLKSCHMQLYCYCVYFFTDTKDTLCLEMNGSEGEDELVMCLLYHVRFCVHGPRHREVVEELVRREVERCDRLAGLMAMMSVAGGTGSGVGTYVTQCLREIHPKSFIVNHLTWPYGTGEVRSPPLSGKSHRKCQMSRTRFC